MNLKLNQKFFCVQVLDVSAVKVGLRSTDMFSHFVIEKNRTTKQHERAKGIPRRGIEPRPRRWERRILTTRPPGMVIHKRKPREDNYGCLNTWADNFDKSTRKVHVNSQAAPRGRVEMVYWPMYGHISAPQYEKRYIFWFRRQKESCNR